MVLAPLRLAFLPSDEPCNGIQSLTFLKKKLGLIPENATPEDVVDHYLTLYQSSGSIIASHREHQANIGKPVRREADPLHSP